MTADHRPFGGALPIIAKSGTRETGSIWRAGGNAPSSTAHDPEVDRRISEIEPEPIPELV